MAYVTVRKDIPPRITAGDGISWRKSFSNYPATSWDLTYTFLNSTDRINIGASEISADGSDFLIEIPGSTSAPWKSGKYKYQAYLTNQSDSDERIMIDHGSTEILPNYATVTSGSGIDTRTHAEKVLDGLEAMIADKATKDQLSYTILGRSISRLNPQEVREWRDYYRAEVDRERRKERKRKGKRTGTKILPRFK